jgi:hypothetical protein
MERGAGRRSGGAWKERHPWGHLAASVAAVWLLLAAVFVGAFEALLFADCARVQCTTGPDADLQRFARLTALVLATMLTIPIVVEWALRLRGERQTARRLRDAISGAGEAAVAQPGPEAEVARWPGLRGTSTIGEAVSRAALRVPSTLLALVIFALDLFALFALVSWSSALYSYSTLFGHVIILGWLTLTMVVPVLTLQYVVFGHGLMSRPRADR